RYTFDRLTSDLWIGDVGQAGSEEINRVPSSQPALNFGWPITEGNHCLTGESCPTDGFVLPIIEYDRQPGCSLTGGYVYRGNRYPQLQGIYLFGDYCNGHLLAIDANRPAEAPTAPTLLLESGVPIASFGEDEAGELYVVGFDGTLYRLVGQ
ncbi:MAG: PQQ-dependent sugar dehydrogenase, partial [Ardenticatenaceae bacterium]